MLLTSGPNLHPASYRDPSGFIFHYNGKVYRQVNKSYQKDYEKLISSGLYQHLVDSQYLLPHIEIAENFSGDDNCFKTLLPEQLSYISYPYEWSFDMLKDAAVLTLTIAQEAMKYGMMLKDATAFNVQWHKGRMIFIDTLSFEILDATKPWIAYRQFCETFFAPLALMHYLQQPLQPLMLAYPEGIPLPLASAMLPWKSKLNVGCYLHLHLNAKYNGQKAATSHKQVSFTQQKLDIILKSLLHTTKQFKLTHKAVWSDYYNEAQQREDYLDQKKSCIEKWVQQNPVKTAVDVGANEGFFSKLLADNGIEVVSTDFDHYSINRLYNQIKTEVRQNIIPLVLDLSNPTPALGVNNTERASFIQRTQTDMVMALAVIHHLCIGKNIPFSSVAAFFASMGKRLIIEFVPKRDSKISEMLEHKKDIYSWYNEEGFLKSFSQYFTILDKQAIGTSGRTLYLMQQNEA